MIRTLAVTCALLALPVTGCSRPPTSSWNPVTAPAAALMADESAGLKTAIFAGGCFWSVEAVFSQTRGVTDVVSGYHGGTQRSARYDIVTSGMTDHAEAVRVTYDPEVVRYDELLQLFFSVVADPTSGDRQGPDRGPEYTAALITSNGHQRLVAEHYLAQMSASGKWPAPIVTPVVAERTFYPAEPVHQDFAVRNPRNGYVQRWTKPKVEALQRLYPDLYSPASPRG